MRIPERASFAAWLLAAAVTAKRIICRVLPGLVVLLSFGACRDQPLTETHSGDLKAFIGARLVDGLGGPPLDDSVMIVARGRIEKVGDVDSVLIPSGAEIYNLQGKTIMPGLINSHGHVGSTQGLQMGPEFYSRENVLRDLLLYARYGVTTVLSLGGDQAAGFELRDSQDTPELTRTRLYLAGAVLAPSTSSQARAAVGKAAELEVNFVKIRVDDNLGRTAKMAPEVYRTVIQEAHQRGLKVAAHIFYLEDAKALLRAGVDFIAHSVRDQEVDEELIHLLQERQVCLCPTLTREVSTFVYESTPDFFEDPFFLDSADREVLRELESPQRQRRVRQSQDAQRYKGALEQAKDNLRKLSEAGVGIAFGTDSGPPARFQGYFEHMELKLMAEAGLEPGQILVSATSGAARCLGLKEVGALEAGRWADFVVLTGDPWRDITQTRSLESVWIAGNRVR